MKYPTVFNMLADIFKRAEARCVLVGGFAVNYYSITRQTIDIIGLIKKNGFNVKESGFKTMSLEYGTEELYEKIVQFV